MTLSGIHRGPVRIGKLQSLCSDQKAAIGKAVCSIATPYFRQWQLEQFHVYNHHVRPVADSHPQTAQPTKERYDSPCSYIFPHLKRPLSVSERSFQFSLAFMSSLSMCMLLIGESNVCLLTGKMVAHCSAA